MVSHITTGTCVAYQDIYPRLMLQMYRTADANGIVSQSDAYREMRRQLFRLTEVYSRHRDGCSKKQQICVKDLRRVHFDKLDENLSQWVFGELHYLESWRPNADFFALRDLETDCLLAACAVSELRWAEVAALLFGKYDAERNSILDLSRVYAFPWAPRNVISKLLSYVSKYARDSYGADFLTSVVDHNLGFSGASYRASNWVATGFLERTPYRYVDHRFRTAGQLLAEFGSMDGLSLKNGLGDRFEQSKCKLQDVGVFSLPLKSGGRWKLGEAAGSDFGSASIS